MAIMKVPPAFTVPYLNPMGSYGAALAVAEKLVMTVHEFPADAGDTARNRFLSGVLFPSAASLLAARDRALCDDLASIAIAHETQGSPGPLNASSEPSLVRRNASSEVTDQPEGPVYQRLCEKAFTLLRMGDDEQRIEALERLVELRVPTITSFLLDELEHSNVGLNRTWLLQALGEMKDVAAVKPLIDIIEERLEHCEELVGLGRRTRDEVLKVTSWDNAEAAIAATSLGAIGDPRAVEPITALFVIEPCARYRADLARALGALGDLEALDHLLPELQEKIEQSVAIGILTALGRLRSERSFEALIAALASPAHRIVEAALLALGNFRDVRAVPAMLPFAEHRDYRVRAASLEALGMIGDPRGVGLLLASVSLRGEVMASAVLRGLGQSRDLRAFPHLVDALESQSLYRRRAAVEALKHCGDPRAIQALIDHLRKPSRRTGSHNVWHQALNALGKIGDERALKFLGKLAARDPDPRVREDAALFAERIQGRKRK